MQAEIAVGPGSGIDTGLIIVRVLRELGLVEEWGTGYRRIMQACQEGGYPPSQWQELGPGLRVLFQPHPAVAEAKYETANVALRNHRKRSPRRH